MRTLAVVAAMTVAGDRLHGCGSHDGVPLEVAVAFPEGPGSHGLSTVGCSDWSLHWEGDHLAGRGGQATCSVVGWRQDGRLRVQSTPFRLDPDAARSSIGFDLPVGPMGGMGAEVVRDGDGIRVVRVVPGHGAARAGLLPGVVIRAVDGVPTSGMGVAEFVHRVVGRPGTVVTVSFDACGDEIERDIVRERIE